MEHCGFYTRRGSRLKSCVYSLMLRSAELSALERSEWARSPIDGTVTAVRVESVGVDGVDVVLDMVQNLDE
jgi:hypothetical protein